MEENYDINEKLNNTVDVETEQNQQNEQPSIVSDSFIDNNDDSLVPENVQNVSNQMMTVRPVKFEEFDETPPVRAIKKNLDIMQDVILHVSVELGRAKSSIKEVMDLQSGSIVELNKIAGEQVEIFVNGKIVAKGEVIVIEDKFGVRVTSTSTAKLKTY